MQNFQPVKERGVPKIALIKQSDVELAKLGGMVSFTAAAREGMAPYVKLGKERTGVIDAANPPKKPRMEL